MEFSCRRKISDESFLDSHLLYIFFQQNIPDDQSADVSKKRDTSSGNSKFLVFDLQLLRMKIFLD